MMAPAVMAGPNGGWGKGLLSETLLFYVGEAEELSGYMYWNPETTDFIYDFHGYYLDEGTYYYLVAFEGSAESEPVDFVLLGSKAACEYVGVHIKGIMAWPDLTGATLCLVPETSSLFGGDEWAPETYQVSGLVNLVG